MTGREGVAPRCTGEVQIGHKEEFFYRKSGQALKGAVQESVEVAIPGGVQELNGHGTQCFELGDKVRIGHRLELVISLW